MAQPQQQGRKDDSAEAHAKLWSMIKDVRVAMMTTWDGHHMHSRPMHGYQEEFAGELFFFTHLNSGKTDEVRRYDQLNLAYADTKDNTYVSVAGRGEVVRDKALIDKYWNRHVAAWFPKGKDDPDTGLIKVTAEGAQYWDSTSSGMVYLFQVVKANLTGSEPNVGEVKKLDL